MLSNFPTLNQNRIENQCMIRSKITQCPLSFPPNTIYIQIKIFFQVTNGSSNSPSKNTNTRGEIDTTSPTQEKNPGVTIEENLRDENCAKKRGRGRPPACDKAVIDNGVEEMVSLHTSIDIKEVWLGC